MLRDEDKKLLIKHGLIIKEDGIEEASILIRGGIIQKIGDIDEGQFDNIINAEGMFVSPGFIDIQVNGGGGYDFLNPSLESVQKICSFHASHGTTSLLATIITAPLEQMREAMEVIRSSRQAGIIGVHLEGPFISMEERGAHNPDFIKKPSKEEFRYLIEGFEDLIKVVTLAPELPGAEELLEEIQKIGAIPALGHSNATYEEALDAINKAVNHFTHLFNAMSDLHPRRPGAVGAALEAKGVTMSLIADGVHIHPAIIRLLVRMKGIENICLITDAISAAGMGEGQYSLDGLEVFADKDSVRLRDGTLAGSLLTMDKAVSNLIKFSGVGILEAVRAASLNPAQLLGISERKGSLGPGKDADITILNESFEVQHTIARGEVIFSKEG